MTLASGCRISRADDNEDRSRRPVVFLRQNPIAPPPCGAPQYRPGAEGVVPGASIPISSLTPRSGGRSGGEPIMKNKFGLGLVLLAATLSSTALADPRHDNEPSLQGFADPAGVLGPLNINGRTDPRNAFFRSLGTNGRSCSSCQVADQAFSLSPPDIRARFEHTHGRDPLFAAFDGANCPNAPDGNAAARSLLLKSGLIRVG